MKLYGAQGVSPQVLLAYALSHGYQLSPRRLWPGPRWGKPYFPQYPPPPHQLEPQRFPGAVRAV